MNEITRIRSPHATTQAADGLPRLKWSLNEFERLSELGFFGGIDGERERVELVDGEIVPMQSKGARHERVRGRLLNHLMRQVPERLVVYSEPGWRPGGDYYFEPEMIVCDARFEPDTVAPADVLLLVEVSDSSIRYDEVTKAGVYAMLGVREYWVVDAKKLSTTVHTEPAARSYGKLISVKSSEVLKPLFVPGFSVSIGSLGIV